jgi:hypothetical protein
MVNKKLLDEAVKVLGPKIVNCIMRLSDKQVDEFEKRLDKLIESKKTQIVVSE